MRSDLSVIDLHVAQIGSYEQGRRAYLAFAVKVFSSNIKSLLQQCMNRVFPGEALPANVNSRPMRDTWVLFDEKRDMVWFSDSLIPFPVNAVVYAFLVEAIKRYAPDADETQRLQLLVAGVPNWQEMKALLADPNNRYAF
jgi:hypothetical protein